MQRPSPMKPVLNRTQISVNPGSHVSIPGAHQQVISRNPLPQPQQMPMGLGSCHSPSPALPNRGLNRAHPQDVRYRSSPNIPIAQQSPPPNAASSRVRHSSVEAAVPKGIGRGSAPGPTRLGMVAEEEVARAGPRGPSPQRPASLQPGKGIQAQAQPPTESRLQYLESELASFTSKMTEMRTAAEALQEEVRVVRPSLDGTGKAPSSAATSIGPPHNSGSDEMDSEATSGWVLDALKKVLADRERQGTDYSSPHHGSATAPSESLIQEMRALRHEVRLEAEARKQLNLKMEAMFLDEKKKRDEVIRQALVQREEQESKIEQRWQTQLKEESSLRRAVESHLEARLVALQREARLEAGNAANQAQQALGDFTQMRERLQQEINAQKLEIGNASADLSRLIDEVRNHGGASKSETGMPSTEITENLIRAEVRRQLAERPAEANVVTSLELQAISTRLERLEEALANEAATRQEESTKSISILHELTSELGKSQMQAMQEFEDSFKTKLNAAMSEAQAAQQSCAEERQLRRQQLTKETKEREETIMIMLKSMEEKAAAETKQFQKLLADQRLSFEQQLRGHDRELQSTMEMSVANFVEKHSQEVVSARHDLLELREEFQEAIRNKRFDESSVTSQGELQRLVEGQTKLWATLDQVRQDIGEELQRREILVSQQSGSGVLSGLNNLDVAELRTQLAAERLAREQGDDRCMENARDMVIEEERKRGREIQALENRISSKALPLPETREETTKSTFLAGTRAATTSVCSPGLTTGVVASSIVRPASSNMLQSPPWPKPPSFSA